MHTDPSPEHAWLKQLVGEWRFEHEFSPGPGEPAIKVPGRERVRMMGDLWAVFEGGGEILTGEEMSYLMTLGFDPNQGCFVGSWVGSPMAHMFIYRGRLDEGGKTLPLETEGPSFEDQTKLAWYRDVIGIEDEAHRTLTSQMRGADGELVSFMQARYERV